jgi:DNA-binding response OmpR family regulator
VTALPGAAAGGRPRGHAGLAIDRAAWSAWLDGEPLDLTYLEFEVLDFLVRHPGRVYSRGALLHQVWGHTLADDPGPSGRTVDVLVTRLRRKLGPQHRGRIETVRRVGYRYRPDAADDLRWCHG